MMLRIISTRRELLRSAGRRISPVLSSVPSASTTLPTAEPNNAPADISGRSYNYSYGYKFYSTSKPSLSKEDDKNNNNNKNNESSSKGPPVIRGGAHEQENLTDDELYTILDSELAKLQSEHDAKFTPNWRPGLPRRRLVKSYRLEDFDEEDDPQSWRPQLDARTGALGIKMGMMPVWDMWGERHACTVLRIDRNVVVRTFREGEDGYYGAQVGAGMRKRKNTSKALLGHYDRYIEEFHMDGTKADVEGEWYHPPYLTREFRITEEKYLPEAGSRIHASHFLPGQNVDVSGTSKGKGFQGAMKRWNFGGMPATHGTSLSHRALGSTGQCQDPGRVFKGKKMAGRMGGVRKTVQNLRIVKIDRGRDLIYVKGAVPGQNGEFVEIKDAVKKPLFGTDKVEGEVKWPPLPTFEYEEGVDGCGEAGFDVFMPLNKSDPFAPENEAA